MIPGKEVSFSWEGMLYTAELVAKSCFCCIFYLLLADWSCSRACPHFWVLSGYQKTVCEPLWALYSAAAESQGDEPVKNMLFLAFCRPAGPVAARGLGSVLE